MSRLTTVLLGLGLTGGIAVADPSVRVDVRPENRVEEVHYRDYHHRPALRVEHYENRRGYRWHRGDWRWENNEWRWHGGTYVRISG